MGAGAWHAGSCVPAPLTTFESIELLSVFKGVSALRIIPVIVLTTSAVEGDRLAAFSNSVAGYMVKPVDYLQFIQTMRLIRDYWMTSASPPRTALTHAPQARP